MSATAAERAKYVMNAGYADETGLGSALRLERDTAIADLFISTDSMEGVQAFSEKRKPRFGR